MNFNVKEGLYARLRFLRLFASLLDILNGDVGKLKHTTTNEVIDSLLKCLVVISKTHDPLREEGIRQLFSPQLISTVLSQNPIKKIQVGECSESIVEKFRIILQHAREYVTMFYDPSSTTTIRQYINQVLNQTKVADNFLLRSIAFLSLSWAKRVEKDSFFDRIFDNELKISLPANSSLKKLEDNQQFQKLKSDAKSILFDSLVKIPFNIEKRQRFMIQCFEELNYLIHSTVS